MEETRGEKGEHTKQLDRLTDEGDGWGGGEGWCWEEALCNSWLGLR